LRRLQHDASVIKLSEVESDAVELLSPKTYPNGHILFNYTTSEPSEQQKQLAPYELFRDPLLVIGVVDGLDGEEESQAETLGHAAAYLRERHPRVIHRQLLLCQGTKNTGALVADDIVIVSIDGEVSGELLRAAMCKVASRFLRELATYTKAMQASPSIQTPGQAVRKLQRTSSLRENERQSGSGFATLTQSTDVSSPAGDDTSSRPPSRGLGSPAPVMTLEQKQGANRAPSVPTSSDSNKSRSANRTSSQDRASGQGLSREKKKDRGKARVGIVVGHIHMMAGQWSDALRMLVGHTNKARSLSDRLWHAKGLEGIVVCMLLLSWAELEFQIPSICYPATDRTSSGHMSRFSVGTPSDFRPSEATQGVSVRRLSTSLPEMLKQILDLYRAHEGVLELPSMLVYEATIRFCKIMAMLFNANSELTQELLASLVEDKVPAEANRNATFRHTSLSKIAIDEILKQAQPSEDDLLNISDHISILAGMASVYALLPMHRRKGLIIRRLVKTTTSALNQARRLGAAEMGIHPAATLSTDTGADAILAVLGESDGINSMMAELAHVYGVELQLEQATPPEQTQLEVMNTKMTPRYPGFGSTALQSEVLQSMMGFFEASPDPAGVLLVATSLLMSVNSFTAIDTAQRAMLRPAWREDQIRLATTIGRAIGVSGQMGLPDIHAEYWDPFLVRGVDIPAPDPERVLLPRSKIGGAEVAVDQTPGNPLLYDPNASRPGTAEKVRHLLIRNEPTSCTVTLQNPFDIPAEIETMQLVATGEDHEIKCRFQPTTVSPMCIQQVPILVSPTTCGDFAITGCRIKVAGCRERVFPIIAQPWSATRSLLVKSQGLEARCADDNTKPGLDNSSFENTQVLASSIPSQALLKVDQRPSRMPSLTLLEGEAVQLTVTLRNVSGVTARIFRRVGTLGVVSFREEEAQEVAPGESVTVNLDVLGKTGISNARADVFYAPANSDSEDGYARLLPVPLAMTVKPSLSFQNAGITTGEDDHTFGLSFDIVNRCHEPLSYRCELFDPELEHESLSTKEEVIAPAETAQAYLNINRWAPDTGNQTPVQVRDQLMERVSVRWRSVCGELRHGKLGLTGMSLGQDHLEIVRRPPVDMVVELLSGSGATLAAKATVKAGSFVTIRTRLANQGPKPPKSVFVQLEVPNDERRVGVIGVPTRLLRTLPEEDAVITDFALCVLSRGKTRVGVVARARGEFWRTERTVWVEAT